MRMHVVCCLISFMSQQKISGQSSGLYVAMPSTSPRGRLHPNLSTVSHQRWQLDDGSQGISDCGAIIHGPRGGSANVGVGGLSAVLLEHDKDGSPGCAGSVLTRPGGDGRAEIG